jgi:acetyltransferase-like isoleucine patch superfamily enzyme
VSINNNCFIYNRSAQVSIGEKTQLAPFVKIITDTHKIGTHDNRCGAGYSKDISIGKGCWIGTGSIILPGVVIGDGVVVGAGSIVTKNLEKNGLYVGCPAKRVKELAEC